MLLDKNQMVMLTTKTIADLPLDWSAIEAALDMQDPHTRAFLVSWKQTVEDERQMSDQPPC
jgi:hypothetical protein